MSQSKSSTFCPLVKWADNSTNVFVTVMVRDIQNQKICVEQNSISFEGISKNQSYGFRIDLYEGIDSNKSKTFKTGSSLLFELVKGKDNINKKWPRLTKDHKKYQFIQIDWDRWEQQSDNQKNQQDLNKHDYNRLQGYQHEQDDEDHNQNKRQQNMDDFYGHDNYNKEEDSPQQEFQDIRNQRGDYDKDQDNDDHEDWGNQKQDNNDNDDNDRYND